MATTMLRRAAVRQSSEMDFVRSASIIFTLLHKIIKFPKIPSAVILLQACMYAIISWETKDTKGYPPHNEWAKSLIYAIQPSSINIHQTLDREKIKVTHLKKERSVWK